MRTVLNWRARQGGWVQWWYATVEAAFDRAWPMHVEERLEQALDGTGVLAPWPHAVRGKEGPTLEISVRVEAIDRDVAAAQAVAMAREALAEAGVAAGDYRLGEPELVTVDEHEAERARLAAHARALYDGDASPSADGWVRPPVAGYDRGARRGGPQQ
jgi:hypothetical protein